VEITGRGRGLVRFTERLRAARIGSPERVRVLVFGDSHVQGGRYPDALRARLVEVFGDGGPGFVYAGSSEHPREGLRQRARGFEPRPRAPSSPIRDERLVGLGGVDFEATGDAAEVEVEVASPAAHLDWELCVRGGGARELGLRIGDAASRRFAIGASATTRTPFSTRPPHRFVVDVPRGAALCGLVGRSKSPGVVVDALGLNGARIATVLARDEASFAEELERAAPDLVIVALGTNETSDEPVHSAAYRAELGELVARVHRAAPEASCLVVGPTPRADRDAASVAVDWALSGSAKELGCAYFSWMEHFQSAARAKELGWLGPDGIHFSAKGYTEMGEALASALLRDEGSR
jgi:lysophospholipase L1-like esterase